MTEPPLDEEPADPPPQAASTKQREAAVLKATARHVDLVIIIDLDTDGLPLSR
jgi:hypothetical protein